MVFSISMGNYFTEFTVFFVIEEPETIEVEQVEEQEIYQDYYSVMQAYYQLDHHFEVDLGQFAQGSYDSIDVFAAAGETFGVLF